MSLLLSLPVERPARASGEASAPLARRPLFVLAVGVLIVSCLGLYGFRLTLGTDLTDEAYYANLAVSRLRLPQGDTGDNSPHQSFGLLLQPAVRLYAAFVPDFTGVMLYLRFLYGAMSLATAFAAWTLLRRVLPAWTAVVVALVPVAFIPFGLPAPSYNTVAMLGTIASLCLYGGHLVRIWTGRPAGESAWVGSMIVPVAGAICALSVVAYPTTLLTAVAFFPIAAFLAPSWKGARPLLSLLFFGVVFLLLGAALVLGVFGLHKISEILAFDRAIGQHKDWAQPALMGWTQFTQHSAFPAYCALGAVITFLGRVFPRPGVRTAGAAGLLLLLAAVLRLPAASFCVRGHDLVFFLAFIGLPILFDLRFRATLSPAQRVLLILYCTGGVSGLLTAWTASNAMFNFPIGGLLATVASLGYIALDPPTARAWGRGRLALPVGSVGALAACSFIAIYGHGIGNLRALDSVVATGPFAGSRTTKAQATMIDQAQEQFLQWEGRCRTVAVVSPFAGLYLMTPLKPRTPCSYFHAFQPAAWEWFETLAVEPTNLPDLVVDFPEPVPPHPAMATLLAAHYRMVHSPGPMQVFLRRDLPAPPHDDTGHTWRHSDAQLSEIIRGGLRDQFNKTPDLTMPPFKTDQLSDQEISDVVAYFKSLWSLEHRQFQEEQNRRPPIPMPSPNAAGGR